MGKLYATATGIVYLCVCFFIADVDVSSRFSYFRMPFVCVATFYSILSICHRSSFKS